jgi:hypothetical protein
MPECTAREAWLTAAIVSAATKGNATSVKSVNGIAIGGPGGPSV